MRGHPEAELLPRAYSAPAARPESQPLDVWDVDIVHTSDDRLAEQVSARKKPTSSGAMGLSTTTDSNTFAWAMTRAGALSRSALLLVLVAVTLGLSTTVANAVPAKKVDSNLSALWTIVLQTSDAQNPFGSGGAAFACLHLDKVVAPFAPGGVASCTVKTGTKVFVAASSVECSTFEGNGTTETELRDCARRNDAQAAPQVTLDGAPVPVTQAETGLLNITLPADNIFGQPAATTGLSVGHGWVTLLHPLTPGTHTIVIGSGSTAIVTRIVVQPGH
jgi:hypothetical protein